MFHLAEGSTKLFLKIKMKRLFKHKVLNENMLNIIIN